MKSSDLLEVVKRALVQYSREFSQLEMLLFNEVNFCLNHFLAFRIMFWTLVCPCSRLWSLLLASIECCRCRRVRFWWPDQVVLVDGMLSLLLHTCINLQSSVPKSHAATRRRYYRPSCFLLLSLLSPVCVFSPDVNHAMSCPTPLFVRTSKSISRPCFSWLVSREIRYALSLYLEVLTVINLDISCSNRFCYYWRTIILLSARSSN
jgi:hypothetical protein